MSLIALTLSNSNSESLSINDSVIIRVLSSEGQTSIEYFDSVASLVKFVNVDESLATIQGLAPSLIELNDSLNSVIFLLNSDFIEGIQGYGTGSLIRLTHTGFIKVEENVSAVNTLIPVILTAPLQYKSLLSQNAPVVSTVNNTMIAGQIWEVDEFGVGAADQAFFDTLELISGVLYDPNSTYRASVDTPFVLTATAVSYDGAPYIVSTDANGGLNPFIDTINDNLQIALSGVAGGEVTIDGGFDIEKTVVTIGTAYLNTPPIYSAYCYTDNVVYIETNHVSTPVTDEQLYYTPFSIEIYP